MSPFSVVQVNLSSTQLVKRSLAVGAALTALGFGNVASAQPNPFVDYEAMKSGAPLPRESDAGSGTVPAAVRFPTTPGSMMLGGRTAFSYTGTNNEVAGGGSVSNRTFLYRITPTFSYLYKDKYLLSGSFGAIGKTITREGGRRDGELDWLLEISAHYVLPISDKVAFLPGAGLGGYLGSSTKETSGAQGQSLTEETSTRGLAITLYANLAYQVMPNWQVRSGLALYGLTGSEKATSQPDRLGSSAVHVGLPVEIFYTF
jgi:opacity protein-like surface antigen